jgi:hypothetical protein
MVNPDRHLHKLDNIITLSQGCVYWKIAPLRGEYQLMSFGAKIRKRGREKRKWGKKKKRPFYFGLPRKGKNIFSGGGGVTVFESPCPLNIKISLQSPYL